MIDGETTKFYIETIEKLKELIAKDNAFDEMLELRNKIAELETAYEFRFKEDLRHSEEVMVKHAEIEQLRNRIAKLEDEIQRLRERERSLDQQFETICADGKLKEKEIARLKMEFSAYRNENPKGSLATQEDLFGEKIDMLDAEIERLKTDYALLNDDYKQLLLDNAKLKSDYTRMRGVLNSFPIPKLCQCPECREIVAEFSDKQP